MRRRECEWPGCERRRYKRDMVLLRFYVAVIDEIRVKHWVCREHLNIPLDRRVMGYTISDDLLSKMSVTSLRIWFDTLSQEHVNLTAKLQDVHEQMQDTRDELAKRGELP